jgi:hypothetical protein
VTVVRVRHRGRCAAASAVLALAWSQPAQADRYEATLAIRPTRGSARIWEDGTAESVKVRSRGFAASANLGMRDWFDLGGELVASWFDEASYQMASLPVSDNPFSGPLKRRSNNAQLRGTATFHLGVGWVPFVQLALGLGARYRTTALLYSGTAQGDRWLIPDNQGEEVTLDLVTGIRAGIERRLTVHWTAGASVGVAHSFGVFRPDLQTSDVMISLAYSWYPLLVIGVNYFCS